MARAWTKVSATAALCTLLTVFACGGDEPDVQAELTERSTTSTAAPTSTSSPTTSTSTTTPAVASPDDVATAEALAANSVVTVEDLPAGWVECCPPTVFDAEALTGHICGAAEGLPPHLAGFGRLFALGLQPDGERRGEVQVASLVAPAVADAGREFEAVDSEDYLPCTTAAVERDGAMPHHVRVLARESAREPVPGGAPGVLDGFTTTYATVDGGEEVVHTEFVRMQIGRVIVRLQIRATGEPLPPDDVASIVAAVAQRVEQVTASDG